MKKRLFLMLTFVCIVILALSACAYATDVCEENQHSDNWALDFADKGVLQSVHALNICEKCNLVLAEEKIAPVVECLGYSYFEGSVVQGYHVSTASLNKLKAYAGVDISYGVVACIEEICGKNPIDENGVASDKAVSYDFTKRGAEYFEIKITNIPVANRDNINIVLCAYVIVDGEVAYVENGRAYKDTRGLTYNEIVTLINDSIEPEEDNGEEYVKLTPEQIGLNKNCFWWSTQKTPFYDYPGSNREENYYCTRIFTKEELPVGSYILVADGWQVRPELWNAEMSVNTTRPYGSNLTGKIEITKAMWNKGGENVFQNIAFNISSTESTNTNLFDYTDEAILGIFEIYVPKGTEVNSTPVEETENNVSIAGLKKLTDTEMGLVRNKYWYSTSSTTIQAGGTKDYYYATKQFTKEELTVGSVIEIELGWQARPEYWVDGKTIKTRPGNTTVYRLVITEDFWDTESERAFNISKVAREKLGADNWDEVVASFKIYVNSNSTLY